MANDYVFRELRFCAECGNLLVFYDATQDGILFKCRFCKETSKQPMTQKPLSKRSFEDKENIEKDIKHFREDPTLPIEKIQCSKCGFNRAKYVNFSNKSSKTLVLYYFCGRNAKKCGNYWRINASKKND